MSILDTEWTRREPLGHPVSHVRVLEGTVNSGYQSSESGACGGACLSSKPCSKCGQNLEGRPMCSHCVAREGRSRVGVDGEGARPKTVTCVVCQQSADLNYSRRIDSVCTAVLPAKRNSPRPSLPYQPLWRRLSDHGQDAMDVEYRPS